MSGLDYINNTKNNLKSRFQGKGVDVTDSTPFGNYPNLLESELRNKSWQYPSDWEQLTPKSEFKNNTVEYILCDEFSGDSIELQLLVSTSSNIEITVDAYTNTGGSYSVYSDTLPLGDKFTMIATNNAIPIIIPKGIGNPNSKGSTTLKITVFSESMTAIELCKKGNAFTPEIVAVRASSKTERFNIALANTNVKYVDLSAVSNLNAIFEGCRQLIKVELPPNTVLKDRHFKNCENLVEVLGADFTATHNAEYVFYNCYNFTPPALNYIGNYSYYNVNLSGVSLEVPDTGMYPKGFISPFQYTSVEGADVGENYSVYLNWKMFNHDSLKHLRNADIHISEFGMVSAIVYTKNLVDMTDYIEDSFLVNYASIINGENLTLTSPVGIYIDSYSNFKDSEINLPNVPLLWLIADYEETGAYGPIQRVVFDDLLSDFSTPFGKISLRHQNMSKEAILDLFDLLPNSDTGSIIDLTGCPGVYELTDEELSVPAAMNWVLIK